MQRRKNLALFRSLRAMTMSAMLTAASVVIGIFCKNFLNFGGGLFRITFENLPILMSGLMFGPVVGGLSGAATDVISYFLSGQVYPINPIVTLGAAMIGIVSGLVSHHLLKRSGKLRLIISCAAAHLVGSVIVKSIGLFQFYGWAVLWRIPLYLVITSLEIILLCLMYRNTGVRRMMDEAGGE